MGYGQVNVGTTSGNLTLGISIAQGNLDKYGDSIDTGSNDNKTINLTGCGINEFDNDSSNGIAEDTYQPEASGGSSNSVADMQRQAATQAAATAPTNLEEEPIEVENSEEGKSIDRQKSSSYWWWSLWYDSSIFPVTYGT